MEVKNS